MTEQDVPVRHALGLGHGHEVLLQVLDHVGAQKPEVDRRGGQPEHDDSVFSANVEAELAQLEALRERGVITDEQYEDEKEQLLKAN